VRHPHLPPAPARTPDPKACGGDGSLPPHNLKKFNGSMSIERIVLPFSRSASLDED
jgi:hypothetical protein